MHAFIRGFMSPFCILLCQTDRLKAQGQGRAECRGVLGRPCCRREGMRNYSSERLHPGTRVWPTRLLHTRAHSNHRTWAYHSTSSMATMQASQWCAPRVETAAPRLCPVHRMRVGSWSSVISCIGQQSVRWCSAAPNRAACSPLAAIGTRHLDVGGQRLRRGVVVRGDAGELFQEAGVCRGTREGLW